jgi:hypothetical protein
MITVETAKAACAEIARMGIGRIAWQRVSDSGGSGRERLAGQFDGRQVTKAQVYMSKSGVWMVMFFLPPDIAGTGPDGKPQTMRRVRLDTVRVLRAGA